MSELVEVIGRFRRADLTPVAEGMVRFATAFGAPTTSTAPWPALVTGAPVDVSVGPDGSFSVLLLASDDPGWGDVEPVPYEVEIRVPGYRETFTTTILGPGPVDLADLIRLA